MKHYELEGHYVVVLAELGIWQLFVSFISKIRGRIFSFSDFFSVPSEVHHQLKLFFCGTKFLSCVCLCVWDKIIQTHILPLYSFNSFSQNWSSLGFFPPTFGSPFVSWVCFHAAQLMMGCGARTHQQCKQRVLPGPCCESSASSVKLSVCLCSISSEVLQKALPWQEWSLLTEVWRVWALIPVEEEEELFQSALCSEDPFHGVRL